MTDPGPAVDGPPCDCKVGRGLVKYGLEDLDEELERRYAAGEVSLRDLAAEVNARLLGAALEATDADVAGDASSVYRALTDDDVGAARRSEVRLRLLETGVGEGFDHGPGHDGTPLDGVIADFVSYGTVRAHLRGCRDVDTGRRGVEDAAEGRAVIEWSRDRTLDVVDRTLDRLRRVGALDTGPVDVTLAIRATCESCGSSARVGELLREGACDCAGS